MEALYSFPIHHYLVLQEEEEESSHEETPAAGSTRAAASVRFSGSHTGNETKSKCLCIHPWRLGERIWTREALLCVCLNIGVDPPGIDRPVPSARQECWLEPQDFAKPTDAIAQIGYTLSKQYRLWHRDARHHVLTDPALSDLRRLCQSMHGRMRHYSGKQRLLFHYVGHGVPKPNANGDVWVFSKDFTQYIPVGISDIQQWVAMPVLYVFDTHNGGLIVDQFTRAANSVIGSGSATSASAGSPTPAASAVSERAGQFLGDSIIITPCARDEILPLHPDLPADLFTCCITTPIKTALRWFHTRSFVLGVTTEMLEEIPGSLNDRTTPFGYFNWVFAAVTDTIAWHVVPREQFQRLFRQDLFLASVMRNFLFADRVMRLYNCHPVSHPRLPKTHDHPLWDSFDVMLECYLVHLHDYMKKREAEALREKADLNSAAADGLYAEFQRIFYAKIQQGQSSPADFEGSSRRDEIYPLHAGAHGNSGSSSSIDVVASTAGVGDTRGSDDLQSTERASPRGQTMNHVELDKVDQIYPFGAASSHDRPLNGADLAADEVQKDSEVEAARLKWFEADKKSKQLREQADELCATLDEKGDFMLHPFFDSQMDSFEVWLCRDSKQHDGDFGNKLPILMHALISEKYRYKALLLLSRYLQRGQEAVDLVLSIGCFPYIEKLLSSPNSSFRKELMFICGKLLAVDRSMVSDLLKVRGELFFLSFLQNPGSEEGRPVHPVYLVMAEYALSCVAHFNPSICRDIGVVPVCLLRMRHENSLVRRWACLCVNDLLKLSEETRREWICSDDLVGTVADLASEDRAPDVRGAAVELLATLMSDGLALIQIGDQQIPTGPVPSTPTPPGSSTLSRSAPQPVSGVTEKVLGGESSRRTGNIPATEHSSGNVSTPTTGGTSGYEVSGSSAPSSFGAGDSGGNQNAYGNNDLNSDGVPLPSGDGDSASAAGTGIVGSSGGGRNAAESYPHSHSSDGAAEAQNFFEIFADVLYRTSERCSSVLVRREVARALSQIAEARFDVFKVGYQLHGLALECERESPGVSFLSGADVSCRNLYVALHRYAHDPHPVVYSHTHAWYSRIVDDLFAHQGNDSFGSVQRTYSAIFGNSPSEPRSGPSCTTVPPTDSFASGLSLPPSRPMPVRASRAPGGSSDALRDRSIGRPTRDAPGSGDSRGESGGLPPLPEASVPFSPTNPEGEVSAGAGSETVTRGVFNPVGFSPAGVAALIYAETRATNASVHTRSASGCSNIDLNRGAGIGNPGRTGGLGEAQELSRRHSGGGSAPSGGTAGYRRPLPMYPVVLASGVGQLIRNVSQTFNFNAPRDGSAERRGLERANEESSEPRPVRGTPTPRSVGPGNNFHVPRADTSLSGHSNVGADSDRSSGIMSGIPQSPQKLSRQVSYQLLSMLSSPHSSSDTARLPMPRNGSFVVGPIPGPDHSGLGRRTSHGPSSILRGDGCAAFLPGAACDNAQSLYEWSCECISRLKFETKSEHCMDMEPEEDEAYGYETQGYRFRAPYEEKVSDQELYQYSYEAEAAPEPGSDAVRWGNRVYSHPMAAGGGSILAIMFLPRHVGSGEDALVLTGDSCGRVGVYEVASGSMKASIGIPGPPGVKTAVTAVVSLNSSSEDYPPEYSRSGESALILAGAVDGRIAVFKSDLVHPSKYTIVSTFRGSGFTESSECVSRVLPIGALGDGQRIFTNVDQMSADLRRDGNGLVLSFHSESSTLVAGGCQGGVVRAWDLRAERNFYTSDVSLVDSSCQEFTTALTMSSALGANIVCYAGSSGHVGVLDMRIDGSDGGSACLPLGAHEAPVVSMASCINGADSSVELLASGDLNGNILLWDLRVNREMARIKAHADIMTTMATHMRSRLIASGGNCVKIFDEQSSISGMVLNSGSDSAPRPSAAAGRQHIPGVTSLAFRSEGSLLAVGHANGTVSFQAP